MSLVLIFPKRSFLPYRENVCRPETLPILLWVSHVAVDIRKDTMSTPRGYSIMLAHWNY
jgi:hypothetical protein